MIFTFESSLCLMLRQHRAVSPPPNLPLQGEEKGKNLPLQGEELAPLPWREGLGEGESPCDCFDDLVPCLVGLRREPR